ncbi:putative SAM-dependent methyltransferase [Brevundimonas vesicularis]|uniref:Putative SAM-dependent methyltransferase n=1 Tax=Brevundimonas vesicularis TaxID=41276 RepID=A0A7W9L518_BREVE|nr:hypothetical protein [Brevundimonas vesicularis]MBB5770905.1 putative SAM-dependent methyltransferase [Brevundimonas vesicularis]
MIDTLAFLRSIPRLLSPTGWLIVAIIAAFVVTGAYCSHRGAQGERDRQAVQTQKTEAKASGARETAAIEREADTTTIRNRQEERDHAAEAIPDSRPDDRELRRRCRQLREAGRSLPDCDGFDRPAQAGPA